MLAEVPKPLELLGGGLVIGGVLLASSRPRRRIPLEPEPVPVPAALPR